MNSNEPLQLSPQALLRYQIVSELEAHLASGATPGQAYAAVLSLPRQSVAGLAMPVSERTLRRWLWLWRRDGLAGLEPKGRPRVRESIVLSEALLQFTRLEKERDPLVSVPELIERARLRGIIGEQERVTRASLWRACRRMGLPLRRPQRLVHKDMRRFAYPSRMLMVLCDGKHFRAGLKRAKRVALHFLDDATRMGLELIVGTSESTELFLHGLYRLIQRHGLFRALFVDHGPGFVSEDTAAVLARLRIHLIHGTAAYPQGHGKVERFHRTEFEQLLRTLDGNPEVDPDPGALSLRLGHWMRERYNLHPHESLEKQTASGREKQSPAERWNADVRPLEFPSDPALLRSCFLSSCERLVSADNVISYGSQAYEVPRGHTGQRLRITRHLLEHGALSIVHEGRLCFLAPVQMEQNAYARRARPQPASADAVGSDSPSAADLAFEEDFGPIVDIDGGFSKREED
jgi:transposase InsO family protein